MENNARSLTLKGLFNITTIVLWTQSPNVITSGLCRDHNSATTTEDCSPSGGIRAASVTTNASPEGTAFDLLGDLGRNGTVHVINHGDTNYPSSAADNDLLNYENVISHVPLLNIIATHAIFPTTTTTSTIPDITSIIHTAGAAAVPESTSAASSVAATTADPSHLTDTPKELNNYWALLALILVIGTAAGNILVCLAITWERRLQNVTNYFLMSLAITDLMVAILVMPLGILTLFHGE